MSKADMYTSSVPKRVLHFLKTGAYSGAENVAITIIEQMKKKYGYEGIYVSISGVIDEILQEKNITHEIIEANSKSCYQQVIDKYQPNVIQAHDFGTSSIIAKCKSNALKISHLHNNPPWLKQIYPKSIVYALAAQKFDCILAVSDSVFDEYVFNRWIQKEKYVVGNPINCERIRDMSKQSEQQRASDIIFLGRLSTPKNPQRFIQIMEQVKNKKPDIHTLMIGKGELEELCRDEIMNLSMEENIEMLGFQREPYGFLKNTKILCVPSDWEGFGLVVVEAFALGIPVVATPVGGMKNLVNEQVGRLCDSDEEFVEEIVQLLSNEEYYEAKSQAALVRADELDNTDEYMQTMYEIYQGKGEM